MTSENSTSARLSDADLRRTIAVDAGRARALLEPGWRSLALVALAAVLLAVPGSAAGLRRDAGTLGYIRTWGFSLVQMIGAGMVLAAGLVRAIPGRPINKQRDTVVLACAVGFVGVITLLTWESSSTTVPPGQWWFYWVSCFSSLTLGLPVLGLAMALAWRGFPLQPLTTGLLVGLGTGLAVDAGLRLVCDVSDPRHVFAAHTAAIAALGVIGLLLGWLWRVRAARRLGRSLGR